MGPCLEQGSPALGWQLPTEHNPTVSRRTCEPRPNHIRMSSQNREVDAFQLLSNRRRRYAVWACRQFDPPIDIGDLAEQIAAWEEETTVDAITAEQRRRVYTSLQQTHLPKLDEAGAIEYERGTVEPREGVEDLEFYLETVPGDDIPWAGYYLGLAGVAAVVSATVWAGIYPASIPAGLWPTLVTLVLGISATVHVWQTRRNRLEFEGPPPEVDGYE